MTIQFETRAGFTIKGEVVEDIGHALAIKVAKGPRKTFVGKTLLFPKNDMANVVTA